MVRGTRPCCGQQRSENLPGRAGVSVAHRSHRAALEDGTWGFTARLTRAKPAPFTALTYFGQLGPCQSTELQLVSRRAHDLVSASGHTTEGQGDAAAFARGQSL